uniref:DNA-directed RNA polymerase n=1 Tax=Meloidogyne floridensis TaxID=298350 RepID=A0A915NQ03_9BILA
MDKDLAQIPTKTKYGILICQPLVHFKGLEEKLKKYFNTEKNNLNNFLIKNRERILSELERNCAENILNINAENWLFMGGTDKNESTDNCQGGIVNELNLKIEEAIERLVKKIPEDEQVRQEYASIRAHYLMNKLGLKLYFKLVKIIGGNEKDLDKLFEKLESPFDSELIENSLYAKTIAEEMFNLMSGNGEELENLKEAIQNPNVELPEEMVDEIKWTNSLTERVLVNRESPKSSTTNPFADQTLCEAIKLGYVHYCIAKVLIAYERLNRFFKIENYVDNWKAKIEANIENEPVRLLNEDIFENYLTHIKNLKYDENMPLNMEMFLYRTYGLKKKSKYPVKIKRLRGTLYRPNKEPACNENRATVLMPGIVKLLDGEMFVPKNNFDLIKSGTVRMTVNSPNFDKPICLNGTSQYLAMPNSCSFNLCEFIGNDLCKLLQTPGIHTIRELEKVLNFNSTQLLPDPPGIFGITLLDILSGEFSFSMFLETEGKTILELQIPTNQKYLQIGLDNTYSEECH